MGDVLLVCFGVLEEAGQLCLDPVISFLDGHQRHVFELATALRVVWILLGHHLRPVGEDEVDPDEVFGDAVHTQWLSALGICKAIGVEPPVDAALQLVVIILGSEEPGHGSRGLVVVHDAFSHHIELTANGELNTIHSDLLECTLFQVDRNAVCLQVSHSRVHQHTIGDRFGVAQLLQVGVFAVDPCFFNGVMQGVAHGTRHVIREIHLLFGRGHPSRQNQVTNWFHQLGG